jgi:hypothetical protein
MKKYLSVEVFTFTYNESTYIDYFVKWYSSRFQNLKITVFDNHSTDDTVEKAIALGCLVNYWGNIDKMSEIKFVELKNNCFKGGESDYFIICDIDEFLDISDADLIINRPTCVQGIGYHMIADAKTDFENIHLGVRDSVYDKCLMFKRENLLEINYKPGAHVCKPVYKESDFVEEILRKNLFHFRWLSLDFVIDRYERNKKRVKKTERLRGMSYHYFARRKKIEREYLEALKNSTSLSVKWDIAEDNLPI